MKILSFFLKFACAFCFLCLSFIGGFAAPSFSAGHVYTISICENSTSFNVDSILAVTDTSGTDSLVWSPLLTPAHGTAVLSYFAASTGMLTVPSGLQYTPGTGFWGTDSFRAAISNGTVIDSITVIVHVGPLPSAGIITGVDSLCVGSTATLSETVPGGGWMVSNSFTDSITASGILYGLHGGTDSIMYVTSNSCGIGTAMLTVTVVPYSNSGTIVGSDSLCQGSSIIFTDSLPGGTWFSSNFTVANIDATGTVTANGGGDDTIVYSVSGICSTPSFKIIHVINFSAGTISGNNALCLLTSGTDTLSSTVPGGIWSSSKPTVAAVSSTGVVSGVSAGAVKIAYTVNDATCGSVSDSFNFSVDIPLQPLFGPTTICQGTFTNIIYTIPSGGTWTSSAPFVAFALSVPGGMGISDVAGITAGTALLTYKVVNSCGTYTDTETITVQNCKAAIEPVYGKSETVSITPNPSRNRTVVHITSDEHEYLPFNLCDVTGKILKTGFFLCNEDQILELELPAGMYLLDIKTAAGQLHEKLIID
jgi:Bacterial Ig-like domain (group 2)